jgi:hypothetical protein
MDEIRQALDDLNRGWRDRRFSDLGQFFDENVVMKGPHLKELLRGRDALVQSYVDFMARSELVEYTESNHRIDRWGLTAAAAYDWWMTWKQDGKTESGTGQDMFVFQWQESRWIAVLRIMLF